MLDVIGGMTGVLQHRGPDGKGIYRDDWIALGHRRLSIIDLSENGCQPLHNEDGDLVLVFNGEIYNFQELSAALQLKGHCFRGASDGEVILHLYEEEGSDCLNHLEGMFAFALYDKKKQQLLLARDRIGEKPLYYMNTSRGFYFSSEIKSFLKIPWFEPTLSDRAALNYFLHTQVPAPYSIYSGISKLIPAHYLVVHRDGSNVSLKPYWRIDYRNKQHQGLSETSKKLHKTLARAVDKCMTSDVPVGVCLSGGVDSSAILALACNSEPPPYKTFTLGSSVDDGVDPEFTRAKRIADLHGMDHHSYHFKDIDFDTLERAVARFDEPVGIPDIVYTLHFHNFVSKHVKVALTGNGADEIFGGYKSYSSLRRNTLLPQALLNALPFRRRLIDWMTVSSMNRKNHQHAELLFCDEMIQRTRKMDVREYLEHYFRIADYDQLFDARLFIDLLVTLNHSAGLADTTGMASSLELRSPFLNHRLIEFSATVPTAYKIGSLYDHKMNKFILKKACGNIMPDDMIFLDKYRCGQFIDMFQMMKTNWRSRIEALLFENTSEISNIFSPIKLQVLWKAFLQDAPSADPFFMMKLLIFLIWYRTSCGPN